MANICASAAVLLKSELPLRAHCTAGLGPRQVFNCLLTFHLSSILQQTKIIHLLLAVSSGLKTSSVCWANASGGRSCSLSRIKNETFVAVVADRCEGNHSRLFCYWVLDTLILFCRDGCIFAYALDYIAPQHVMTRQTFTEYKASIAAICISNFEPPNYHCRILSLQMINWTLGHLLSLDAHARTIGVRFVAGRFPCDGTCMRV